MVPLRGNGALLGSWPEAPDTFLLQVTDKKLSDGGIVLTLRDVVDGCEDIEASPGELRAAGQTNEYARRVQLPAELDYLGINDCLGISKKNGRVRVLFRYTSPNNNFLITEQCDHYCLMCSQPPRNVKDDALVDEIQALLPFIPKDTAELGFSGGEPTLRGNRFIEVLQSCKANLPNTALHVLTNGRRFADRAFAAQWAAIGHRDLMAGIPIYSDQSTTHDYVVQADGAFDETIRGVLNLKSLGQAVEIRLVLHRHTIGRVERFAEFIVRNLPFVDHVALMGLELIGFALANQNDLWISLRDHQEALLDAAQILRSAGLRVSIYNVPLCLLHEKARPFAVRSISDWKREYWPQCSPCELKDACGGTFFSSRARLETEISPVIATT